MNTADPHTLTGAYAAHALSPEENGAFERHLAGCPACAQEVAEFAATLARLGAAEATPPPPAMKQRVLAALPGIRQEPPRVAPPGRRPGRIARSAPRLALAACLALAVGAGAIAVQQHREAGRARDRATALEQRQQEVAALLTAPDARTATAAAEGGTGTVVWSVSRGRAGFLASGLPAPAPGRTYQLWFNDAGTMRPAGLLPTGSGTVLLTGPLDGAAGIGVTVEPLGGSTHPSGNPVLLLPFT
ncbi:anti-sigma factor domain-containing protein [Streptomyces sp. TLI_171]|uniref:anti-sigma factor n=1 Tax=Streptomyces sp. TLI_171 TaxID=1938859 RepID=UPI000C17D24C|nr:anti-sigma factor [Streptomyces sp. TLI_171]RKE17428.1 putative zinc finger protein [Streptomyces sp. TLI_171]